MNAALYSGVALCVVAGVIRGLAKSIWPATLSIIMTITMVVSPWRPANRQRGRRRA